MAELTFISNPVVPRILVAKYRGHSIIKGSLVRNHEIKFPNGDVQAGLSREEVNTILDEIPLVFGE